MSSADFEPVPHPPRVAVVGYGYAGRAFHSYLVSLTPGLRLHGIVARDPAKRAAALERHPGVRVYPEFEDALADPDTDLVVLATPNHTHADLAVRALGAGRHVVTDKILCLSLADCDRMIAAARAARRHLSVFQNRRWDGDFLTLRHLVATGRLGELRWLECAWQGPRPMSRWRAQAAQGGGRFLDLGAHLVDQVLLLLRAPVVHVHCRMQHDHPGTDTESHALLTLGFADGRTAVVDTGSSHWISKPRFYAVGMAGTFQKHGLDPQEEAMKAGAIDAAREQPENAGVLATASGREVVPTLPGRWRTYYEIIAAELTGAPPPDAPVRLEEARRAMAVFDAALRSAREGRSVATDIPGLDGP